MSRVPGALRKAYGIGLCSVEEIGSFPVGSGDHLQPAILAVGFFSLSPIELGLPCGRFHAAPLVLAFGSAPYVALFSESFGRR